jgi:hypothetical protein
MVAVALQELIQKVSICTVNLNTIKSGLNSIDSTLLVHIYNSRQFRGLKSAWNLGFLTSLGRDRDGGGRDAGNGISTAQEPKLHEDESSLVVNSLGDLLPSFDLISGENTWDIRIVSCKLRDKGS